MISKIELMKNARPITTLAQVKPEYHCKPYTHEYFKPNSNTSNHKSLQTMKSAAKPLLLFALEYLPGISKFYPHLSTCYLLPAPSAKGWMYPIEYNPHIN